MTPLAVTRKGIKGGKRSLARIGKNFDVQFGEEILHECGRNANIYLALAGQTVVASKITVGDTK